MINLIKPPGISSFGALKQVRELASLKKVGHTGTLDPAVSGVLPLCVGRATKLADYLLAEDKSYWCEIHLGIETDTDDAEGKILAKKEVQVSPEELEEALLEFRGISQQTPPDFSAVKLAGVPAYKRSRKGEKVNIKARQIEIYQLEIIEIELPLVRFTLDCSKGTYVRSLARDLGRKLGCGAFLNFLIRTKSGPFLLEDTCTLEDLREEGIEKYLLPLDFPLAHLPLVRGNSEGARKIKNGLGLSLKEISLSEPIKEETSYRFYNEKNEFIALCRFANQRLHPFKVFI